MRALLPTLVLMLLATTSPAEPVPSAGSGERDMRIVTVERKPFAMSVDDKLSGFSIELWEVLAERLGWQYSITIADAFSDMLEAVGDGSADIAIGNISITADRENGFDFSHPVFDAGLQILIPEDGAGSFGVLAAIFTWEMAAYVVGAIAVIFLIANLMWFFERRDAPYFQRGYREGLWPSFWYAMHVMISGGFEEHVPRSIPARILGITLVICSLFLVSAFVAKIASTMTVNELRSDIESVSDLYGKRVGTTRGSTAAGFLQAKGIEHVGFDDIAAMFAALRAGKLDALVHDAPVLRYYAAAEGRGTSRVVGSIFKPEKYGIVMAQGSRHVEPVNRALLALRENGSYNEIYRRWFGATASDN